MTNKQTIDGVSRDLIERMIQCAEAYVDIDDSDLEELRALLDNKKTEHAQHTCGLDKYSPCFACNTPVQPQGEVDRLLKGQIKSLEVCGDLSEKQRDHWMEECRKRDAQLAERDALLREMRDLATAIPVLMLAIPNPHDVASRDKHIESVNALIERCDATLSAAQTSTHY